MDAINESQTRTETETPSIVIPVYGNVTVDDIVNVVDYYKLGDDSAKVACIYEWFRVHTVYEMMEFANAVNYLNCPELFDDLTRAIANYLKRNVQMHDLLFIFQDYNRSKPSEEELSSVDNWRMD
jgi:hypothetical protein